MIEKFKIIQQYLIVKLSNKIKITLPINQITQLDDLEKSELNDISIERGKLVLSSVDSSSGGIVLDEIDIMNAIVKSSNRKKVDRVELLPIGKVVGVYKERAKMEDEIRLINHHATCSSFISKKLIKEILR